MIFEMNDINHTRSEDSSQPLIAETQAGVVHHLDEEELSSSSSLDAFSSMSPILGFSLPTTDHHSTVVTSTTTTTSESALNASTKPATTTTGGVYEFVNPAYLSSTDFLPAAPVANSKHRSREEPSARHHIAATTAPFHRTNHHTKSHHHANVNSSKIKTTTGVLWPSSNTATAKPLKCICKNNEKHFKCFSCTQNYPISVRRSKDDEASTIVAAGTVVSAANQLSKQQKRAKERMEFEARFNSNNNNNNSMQQGVKSQHHNQQQQAAALTSQSYSESSSIESHTSSSLSSSSSSSSDSNVYDATILKLKPSPIPISSTLIALLALTNPGNNKFRPPPNVNLAHHVNHQSHVDKK